MDCAPLNLAHFHERRAERFMRLHRYDEAYKALETSLLYLQDAYKIVNICKSQEVLNTLRWDFERKLCQIQMRKQQHDRLKLKDIVPLSETNSMRVQTEVQANLTGQLIARSIDKTIANFDAKFNQSLQQLNNEQHDKEKNINKENLQQQQTNDINNIETTTTTIKEVKFDEQLTTKVIKKQRQRAVSLTMMKPCEEEFVAQLENVMDNDNDDLPSLVPLELPTFDFNVFTTSAPSLAYILHNDPSSSSTTKH